MARFSLPLIDVYKELGASIGEFEGWQAPICFDDILAEAAETRRSATFFDISHLSRIAVRGDDAFKLLQRLVAKDLRGKKAGRIVGPTAFLNEWAGFKDDVLVYVFSEKEYLVVGNAANYEKDLNWLRENARGLNVEVEDLTLKTCMIAVQGPRSPEVFTDLCGCGLSMGCMHFATVIKLGGVSTLAVSESGWTGERGFEVILEPGEAEKLVSMLISAGVKPAGLGARDVLRIEMGYRLYGHEIDEDTTPLEARYWVFSWNKSDDYIGKDALYKKLEEGVDRIFMAFVGKKGCPIPRPGCKVYAGSVEAGYITSGTFSPMLGAPVALGYLKPRYALAGLKLAVRVRGNDYPVRVVDPPLVR